MDGTNIWTIAGLAAVCAAILIYVVLQVLCLKWWSGRYRLLASLPLLWWAAWGAVFAIDVMQDPSSHDHWPIEVVAAVGPSLILLLIVLMLHRVTTGRWFDDPES